MSAVAHDLAGVYGHGCFFRAGPVSGVRDQDGDSVMVVQLHRNGQPTAAIKTVLKEGSVFVGIPTPHAPALCRAIYEAAGLIWRTPESIAAEAREKALLEAAHIAGHAHLVEPDGGSPTDAEADIAAEAERRILALIGAPS